MADEASAPVRLGGMALQNGLFVHSARFWAAAVRDGEGRLHVADGEKTEAVSRLARVPLARGVARMAEMLALLPTVRRALPAARLPFESPGLIALGLAGSVATTGLRRSRLSPVAAEAAATALSLVPALVTLRSPTLTRYHGAEHKTIGAYETGGRPEDAPKEHERCGSHLVGPLLGVSAVANVLAAQAPKEARNAARAGASIASIGVAVEIFGWMERHRAHPAARALRAPGTALQRAIGTREPGPAELEVAEAALARLLEREHAA